jgi:hypothetical protein
MPYPSTPCRLATPETALRPFQGWPARRVGGLRPSVDLFGPPMPYAMKVCSSADVVGIVPGGRGVIRRQRRLLPDDAQLCLDALLAF